MTQGACSCPQALSWYCFNHVSVSRVNDVRIPLSWAPGTLWANGVVWLLNCIGQGGVAETLVLYRSRQAALAILRWGHGDTAGTPSLIRTGRSFVLIQSCSTTLSRC
jgi:hypothetical protein